MISVVIPAKNEAARLNRFVARLVSELRTALVPYEIVVVNDELSPCVTSDEPTLMKIKGIPGVLLISNPVENAGFGNAVRVGLYEARGDFLAIMMADGSDSPLDLIAYYRKCQEGYDCVFGNRFMTEGRVSNYPFRKYLLNRIANRLISIFFRVPHDDITNAFKCYSRSVIREVLPELRSRHFEITVELPLKAFRVSKKLATLPISWTADPAQESSFKFSRIARPYIRTLFAVYKDRRHG